MAILGLAAKLTIGVLFLSILIGYLNFSTYTFYEKDLRSRQVELNLNETTQVLTQDGKLSQIGWLKSRENLVFNPNRINPFTSYFKLINKMRYKKWEAYAIFHKDFIMGLSAFDVSYIGGYFIHYADMTSKNHTILFKDHLNPFKKPEIADECYKSCIAANYSSDDFMINEQKTDKPSDQFLKLKNKDSELNVELDLSIKGKDHDSLVTLNPISADTTLFYYNQKINTLQATGTVKINNKTYDASELLITYDTGRGVFPVRSGWVWGNGNGRLEEENLSFGINFGHGFSEPSVSTFTEDCFFVEGKVYKLNSLKTVEQEIKLVDGTKYNKITFSSKSDDQIKNYCNFEFIPKKKYDKGIDLGIISDSFVLQYGLFTGTCINLKGKSYSFNINGLLEKKTSIW